MNETQTSAGAPAASAANWDLLDDIITEGRMALQKEQHPVAKKLLERFVDQSVKGEIVPRPAEKSLMQTLQERIDAIDAKLTESLNQIMHAPQFQALEQSWRGLHDLVQNSETSTRLKLRVINMTKEELATDLKKAVDHDQSNMFKKVYEDEYGTFGGNPFSVLVGDYHISRSVADLGMLAKIAGVAAMAHAPFITAAAPELFDMASFTGLGVPRDLAKTFESAELSAWRAFRETEDARYVALTLPRYLLRLPYGEKTVPVPTFRYEETCEGMAHDAYLWGNSAYLLTQRITEAFAQYGWSAAIRGVEGGGVVAGLPIHTFDTAEGDIAAKCPTEVLITDRREKELNDLGFIAVVHKKNENFAAFFGGQTVNKPAVYNKPLATANARLSAQLPCILAASRFAHYIKVIMRDKIGSFASRESVSNYLNTWIADYVLVNDNASQSLKAQYPLREARIDVTEDAAKPGVFRATVFLRPHFQLEELTASIRLVAELPQPVTA
ncbi:type VI secretion system contractile sheath large subunit [Massilia sp. CF038]|uniref:type VI secretion system contractile sheath large subunit n=1 Tax=Massilia sp. CF038 TaxID=1881045 RepID=UPI000920A987|nr:type VI secretion system contractile sheath large subunit [Massilia sp. CF038]SHH10160.1 type VI secretion system protein ImpC [Massilia sp. CF038]